MHHLHRLLRHPRIHIIEKNRVNLPLQRLLQFFNSGHLHFKPNYAVPEGSSSFDRWIDTARYLDMVLLD